MPMYDFACGCGRRIEVFQRAADALIAPTCACGKVMHKQLSAPYVRGDYAGYSCPVSGAWIEGRAAHKENLAKHNCRILETGEKEMNQRKRAAAQTSFDKSIGETVEKQLAEMPADKLSLLAHGVSNGLDVTIERN